MVDETLTYKEFGYYSYELTSGSHKKVMSSCNLCGKMRILDRRSMNSICRACSGKKRTKIYPTNYCSVCLKVITRYATKCGSCARKKPIIIKYCEDCGKKVSYRSMRCKSCSKKGKLNASYTHGLSNVIKLCLDCGKKLSRPVYTYCKKCSEQLFSGKNAPQYGKIMNHGIGGRYKGAYMRSTWEIKYAKYCIKNKIKYRYEPRIFPIEYSYKGIRKEGTYRPDFYHPETDEYIEIKGWWRGDAKVKLEAFKERYKDLKIKVLMKKELEYLGLKVK